MVGFFLALENPIPQFSQRRKQSLKEKAGFIFPSRGTINPLQIGHIILSNPISSPDYFGSILTLSPSRHDLYGLWRDITTITKREGSATIVSSLK
jgi:hypothetical protein